MFFISDNCLYTTGHRCINGACLDSQCHCNDGWGGKGCSMPDENECKYRWVRSEEGMAAKYVVSTG